MATDFQYILINIIQTITKLYIYIYISLFDVPGNEMKIRKHLIKKLFQVFRKAEILLILLQACILVLNAQITVKKDLIMKANYTLVP